MDSRHESRLLLHASKLTIEASELIVRAEESRRAAGDSPDLDDLNDARSYTESQELRRQVPELLGQARSLLNRVRAIQ